jgi:hypothetical protein
MISNTRIKRWDEKYLPSFGVKMGLREIWFQLRIWVDHRYLERLFDPVASNTLDDAEDEFQLEDADKRIAFITSKINEINARIAEIQSQTPGTV